jgi:hypothetical protein
MKTFTIENETNNISIHASARESESIPNSERFGSEAALAKLAVNWPAARLVDIWNSVPGETPVKKFKDRASAIARIWKSIQKLGQAVPATVDNPPLVLGAPPPAADSEDSAKRHVAEAISDSSALVVVTPSKPQTPDAALAETPSRNAPTRVPETPVGHAEKKGFREGSKTGIIIALMKQPHGTTLKAVIEATGWQAHSVRGFISGTLGKKLGLAVTSAKGETGERAYYIRS